MQNLSWATMADEPGVVVKTLPWNNMPAGYVVKA
jgi:hypothetical protein